MKQPFLIAFLLIISAIELQAQASLYLQYQPGCMRRHDFVSTHSSPRLGFTDFHLPISETKTYIFRVIQDIENHSALQLEGDILNCNDLSLLRPATVEAINKGHLKLYLFSEVVNGYLLTEVAEIQVLEHTPAAWSYKGSDYQFIIQKQKVYTGAEYADAQHKMLVSPLDSLEQYEIVRMYKSEHQDPANPGYKEVLFHPQLGLMGERKGDAALYLTAIDRVSVKAYLSQKYRNRTTTSRNAAATPPAAGVRLAPAQQHTPSTSPTPWGSSDPFPSAAKPAASPAPVPAAGAILPAASPVATPSTITYRVQSGDCLYDIARRFNTTTAQIIELNKLPNDKLHINQILIIIPGPPK